MGFMGSSGQFFAAASSSHFSLLQCRSSPWVTVLQDKPAPTWVHQRMQFPSEGDPVQTSIDCHTYSCLHRQQCGYLLHHDILHGLQGHTDHHDLHQGLQGNLIFSAQNAFSPPFSQSFAVCRAVCLTAFPHSSHCCLAFCPFLHTFPQKGHQAGCGAQPCPVVGWLELSGAVRVWHGAALAAPHRGHPQPLHH